MTITTHPTVGLLYAGEMGTAVAAVLRDRGVRIISTLAGRSARTAARCQAMGIELLASMDEVVRQSDVVLSLVPPTAAESVAADYARRIDLAPANAIYVDFNSISPELSQSLAGRIGRQYVDGAINGLARNLTSSGTVFLSGPRAGQVAGLFEGAARVRVLGEQVGAASAMKMLLAGLSKGLCGLFAELALLARRHDMLEAMLHTTREIYPGLMLVIDRMLPTYAQHAGRRAGEMSELQATAEAAGLQPPILSAVRELHEQLAGIAYQPTESIESLIERLDSQQLLHGIGTAPVPLEHSAWAVCPCPQTTGDEHSP